MPLQVEIPDDAIQYLNEPAQEELRKCLAQHAEDVLKEAGRLEANIRDARGDPQITGPMVSDAALLVGRHYVTRRQPAWLKGVKIGAAVAALVTGLIIDQLTKPWGPAAFAATFAVAAILTIVSVLKE